MRIDVCGDIVINKYMDVYEWMGWDATCPKTVTDAIAAADDGEALEVYVSSNGGHLDAGRDIYAALRDYPGPVNIHVIRAYSAASFIPCAGQSDIIPGGSVMLHCVMGRVDGNKADMAHMAEILNQMDRTAAEIYAAKSGRPEAEFMAMMEREVYLTAQEAVDMGLVDSIADEALRLTASASGTNLLTDEQIEKIRALMPKPDTAHIRAELDLLKLGGRK